ncbi:hypothetical protein QQF64_034213 [Cirrhinus molitorella]|uniref:Uncharacterized protein n=1 Tax=Cirrhinus molitorella TaxID=172907 RepID=A0ABR3MW23_9TELE
MQNIIDDYQREYMGRVGTYVKSHTLVVLDEECTAHDHLISLPQSIVQDTSSLPLVPNTFKQPELSAEPSSAQYRSGPAPDPPAVQTMSQNTQQPESQVLSPMMEMLVQLMDRVQSRDVPTHRGSSRLQCCYGRNACRQCEDFWRAVSGPTSKDSECERFLSILAGLYRWRGKDMPEKIGTVKCNSAVCLEPGCEYLVWGKLSKSAGASPGSAVLTEPTTSHSVPRGVMVARLVTSFWSDEWVPLKVINTSGKPVLLNTL